MYVVFLGCTSIFMQAVSLSNLALKCVGSAVDAAAGDVLVVGGLGGAVKVHPAQVLALKHIVILIENGESERKAVTFVSISVLNHGMI